jgi:hypothetical protein
MHGYGLLLFVLLVAGCGTSNTPPAQSPPQDSAWGTVLTIGIAEQAAAPAISADDGRIISMWTEADDNGVYHAWRSITLAGGSSSVIRLPVLAYFPQGYRLHDTGVLWADADPDSITDGLRVWLLRINQDGTTPSGARLLTDSAVATWTSYTVDVGLWVIYSTANRAEPTLYSMLIDPQGRSRPPETVTPNGMFPAVYTDINGQRHLVWQQDTVTLSAAIAGGRLTSDPQRITQAPALGRSDRITALHAATDTHHRYLIWHIVRGGAYTETWISTAPHLAEDWSTPQRLGIRQDANAPQFETGFGSTSAKSTTNGDQWADYGVTVGHSPFDRLPIAAHVNGVLGIVYIQGTSAIGWQPLITTSLIAPPQLVADDDNHLYLAWSQPQVNAPASLNLISTR